MVCSTSLMARTAQPYGRRYWTWGGPFLLSFSSIRPATGSVSGLYSGFQDYSLLCVWQQSYLFWWPGRWCTDLSSCLCCSGPEEAERKRNKFKKHTAKFRIYVQTCRKFLWISGLRTDDQECHNIFKVCCFLLWICIFQEVSCSWNTVDLAEADRAQGQHLNHLSHFISLTFNGISTFTDA